MPHELVPRRRIAQPGASEGAAGPVVVVIGAGFSGTMAAIHLRRSLPRDHVVYLFDRSGRFARGPAYAASGAPYLLNVRAANMSALPDDAEHFLRWLDDNGGALPGDIERTEAGVFASRRLYGRYLRQLLYREMTESGGRVLLGADEVTELVEAPGGYALTCASGRTVVAACVVLTVGNLPSQLRSDGVVVHDPWVDGATSGLRSALPVMVVGTGLTMIDLALGMRARGFDGKIIALSRRGLVPQPHAQAGGTWPTPEFNAAQRRSLVALLRALRAEVARAAARGIGWRAVIDALRPVTTELWGGLPAAERARFLRHLRPFWDVHRHRIAPVAATHFATLRRDGGVIVQRGRIEAVARDGERAIVEVRGPGTAGTERVAVQRLIYATGPGLAAGPDRLINWLIAGGLARADAHGLGLEVTDTLQLVGAYGRASPGLWALGPIVRGVFWECTAVPDIRHQARAVAEGVARAMAEGT